MQLTKKSNRRQKAILERIKAGLPVAGLITGMVALTGCEGPFQPVGTEPNRTVGKEPAEKVYPLAGVPQMQQTVGEVPESVPNSPASQKPNQPNAKCERSDALQAVGIEPKREPVKK